MTGIQRFIVLVTAFILFLLGFAWLFSDASVGNEITGLLVQFILIGIPAYLLYKAFGRKKK